MHQLIHYNMGSKSAIGIGNGICFKQVRDKGGGSYIDPLVRDSIVGLWKFDQNTNESPTRNIIKNTIKDKGGDLELLNFGYKLNSGYNGYLEDFTSWKNSTNLRVEYSNDGSKCKITSENIKDWWQIAPKSGISNSFKVKITNCHFPIVWRYTDDGNTYKDINIIEDGIYNLPQSIINNEGVVNKCYFGCDSRRDDYTGLTIEQLPLHEGALVTDGKDDMIVSQKTVQEMGITDKITVVSMIHQIGRLATNTNLFTNCIQANTGSKGCNIVNYQTSLGKTGIYGYSRANVSVANNEVVINNILGDKADYLTDVSIGALTSNEKFSVVGYLDVSPQQVTSVAVYWTFIANKVLTADQINQVISYFNLDKHVKPDIIYDTIRQGITNENHASFNDELVDFFGNGHNLKLYNLNWDKQSGIGSYPFSFKDYNYFSDRADVSVDKSNFVLTANFDSNNFLEINTKNREVPSFKIKAEGIDTITNGRLAYRIAASDGSISIKYISEDGEYEIPGSSLTENVAYSGFYVSGGINDNVRVKVTIIPDYEGALVSDGIDDYGKVENLPIYKDYTVAIDRAWTNDLVKAQCLTSKLNGDNFGSFSFELIENGFSSYSFGISNKGVITIDSNKKISYQSKYVYNGSPIISGNNVDGKDLFLFRNRDSYPYYAEAAIWSYILFPYSLSEFLLERQLKKYKLGTLYPNMVEFRPVIEGNLPYSSIQISQGSTMLYDAVTDKTGTYLTEGSTVRIYINPGKINKVSSIAINGVVYTDLLVNVDGYYYADFPIAKSPQKISYAIDEYIRYEDIVQPYPAIINLKQDGKTITWGDKLKVGSDIVFVGNANLLPELYTVSETRYNGVTLYPNTIIKVEKSMVFDNARTYLKANEPTCILSPNRLRIPNSSYKILGYIPDLTGKGNHGRLNNFAYAGMSGANRYVEDFTKWEISKSNIVSTISDSSIHFTHIGVNYEQTTAIFEARATSNKKYNIKVRISGLTSNMRCFSIIPMNTHFKN